MSALPRRLVLLGHPVAHSLSPLFQNAALVAAEIPLRYEAIDVTPAALDDTMEVLVREGAAGNVTIPHKASVAALCVVLKPAAVRTGVVNTFWVEDGDLVGDNTDIDGFDAAVLSVYNGVPGDRRIASALVAGVAGARPRNQVVGVLGAGGAAAAVLAAIEGWVGCTALVHNRTEARAVALCERFRSVARVSDAGGLATRADLVVNATAIGLRDDTFPIDPSLLRPGAAMLDLVYRPGETAWVRAARERGHRAMDGLTMLVEQGAQAFARWFGREPDREVMWNAVRAVAGTRAE